MKIMHHISGTIINWIMNNKYVLITLNYLVPVAVYFEAGPVSAFATYFGFFLLVSVAMTVSREERKKEEMGNVLEELLGDKLKTTRFETDDYEGSVTSIHEDDIPESLREIIKSQAVKEEDMPEELKEVLDKVISDNKDKPTKH